MRAGCDPKIPPPISIWLNWNAVIKGVNAALAWKLKKLHLRNDCLTVYHGILNGLSGKVRLKTKASSEMLNLRHVDTIKAPWTSNLSGQSVTGSML